MKFRIEGKAGSKEQLRNMKRHMRTLANGTCLLLAPAHVTGTADVQMLRKASPDEWEHRLFPFDGICCILTNTQAAKSMVSAAQHSAVMHRNNEVVPLEAVREYVTLMVANVTMPRLQA